MDKSKKSNKKKADDISDDEEVEVKPVKGNQKTNKKGQQRKGDSDSESDVSDSERKPKSKPGKNAAKGKGQKNKQAMSDEESEDERKAKPSKANKKSKNNKDSDDEEDSKASSKANAPVKANQKKNQKPAAKNAMKKNQSDDEDDDEDNKPVVSKPQALSKASAFQLLAMEGDSDDDDDKSDKSESEEEQRKVVNQKQKGKKGKQNKKQAKTAEEEDIDKIVAGISNMTTSGQKGKGDKKKDAAEKDETEKLAEEKATPAVAVKIEMSQEEAYRLMEEEWMDEEGDKKKKKKGKQQQPVKKQDSKEDEQDEEEDGETSTVKAAAQKRKEKKERQKAERQQKKADMTKGKEIKQEKVEPEKSEEVKRTEMVEVKKEAITPPVTVEKSDVAKEVKVEVKVEAKDEAEANEPAEETTEESKTSKKDKGKKGKKDEKDKDKDKEKEKAKKPSKRVQEILDQQRRIKEEQDKIQREEEERIRKEEEAIRLKEEEERRIREKKEKLKQKKKEKIERQKMEGTFLTDKQKEDRRRLMQMVESLQQQLPDEARAAGTEKKHPRYEKKSKKGRQGQAEKSDSAVTSPVDDVITQPTLVEEEKQESVESKEAESVEAQEEVEEDDVKDAWDMSSEEEEEEDSKGDTEEKQEAETNETSAPESSKQDEAEEESESSEEESEEEESSSEEDDGKTGRERALARIQKRKQEADEKRTKDNLRAPVVCVLGHVDTGKTKILDKLRRTNVQDGEAGGITQQIGATNVPQDTIKEQTKMVKEFQKQELKLPGLLIIDTPGHESFSNLRSRGSSLCDIAILVVDIMHGLEPQTIESINLLKQKNTPFVVALNKIDRLYGWQTNPHSDVVNTLKRQSQNTRLEFNDRLRFVITQFAEQGLNAILFNENKDPDEYFSLVPTSAHTGDGMGNLIALICDIAQSRLADRLMYSEELKATVMEVKTIHGLGTTIDVILVNGKIHEGDHIVVAGQEGPIYTPIRALLMPQPLRELRVKSQYEHHKEVVAAQGCKIVAKDLEKALAGLPLYVTSNADEAEFYKEELSEMLKTVLADVKVTEKGVFVQASTLGSLEALLQFLKTSEIPYAGINIGPVHKKDIMRASVMLEHDPQYAVILAFDVKVEHEAQTMADSLGVRIFTADIIYHLFDAFTKYREDFKRKKREEFKSIAVFPCKLRIMPQYVFNSRDPIVVGVIIEAGFLKEGTLLCVPSKEFVEIGRVSSIEINHKPVDRATKGQEVCIKIDPIPGESPKMFGRHFDEKDTVVSKISRQSIDAVKNYFREEMTKTDWQLIMELKKVFEIL